MHSRVCVSFISLGKLKCIRETSFTVTVYNVTSTLEYQIFLHHSFNLGNILHLQSKPKTNLETLFHAVHEERSFIGMVASIHSFTRKGRNFTVWPTAFLNSSHLEPDRERFHLFLFMFWLCFVFYYLFIWHVRGDFFLPQHKPP